MHRVVKWAALSELSKRVDIVVRIHTILDKVAPTSKDASTWFHPGCTQEYEKTLEVLDAVTNEVLVWKFREVVVDIDLAHLPTSGLMDEFSLSDVKEKRYRTVAYSNAAWKFSVLSPKKKRVILPDLRNME